MENSPKINDAIEKVFDEMIALSMEEFEAELKTCEDSDLANIFLRLFVSVDISS